MASDKMLLLQRALSDKCSSPFSLLSTTLLDLTGQITRESDYYSAYGGSADVWKGTWLKDTAERKVCVNVSIPPGPDVVANVNQGRYQSRSRQQRLRKWSRNNE